ncbi:DUF3597 domain-containing protein [Sphingomonas japonica]|uniref:3-oxoacyl-ACP reductase-like protein n=1 Tax=Sphingomonas japonica TaxID=511662 RepID=A0ABX0U1G1_9SPHN|nr:DUF3597 domain-containing protein [Sphingomonas japonica]NIJ24360.1 3-oxoacyl-ACP reductase-like protein [Sphingomonas japonica]
MSIFGKIKDAIFGGDAAARPVPRLAPVPAPTAQAPHPAPIALAVPPAPATAAPSAPPQTAQQRLIELAAFKGNPELNWQSSIVDLMKLLDLDSSLANRKELATELGYTGPKDGSAEMNIWLHKAVMRQLGADTAG